MSKLVHMLLVTDSQGGMVTLRFRKVYLTLSVSWILLHTTYYNAMIILHTSTHNSASTGYYIHQAALNPYHLVNCFATIPRLTFYY
jgi:hypothetical protein